MNNISPPKYVRQVLFAIQSRGHMVCLVGGCVRDMLLAGYGVGRGYRCRGGRCGCCRRSHLIYGYAQHPTADNLFGNPRCEVF